MEPFGIRVGAKWMAPILAVRDGPAGVVLQTEGLEQLATHLDAFYAACA
jgi:hypothetical protein